MHVVSCRRRNYIQVSELKESKLVKHANVLSVGSVQHKIHIGKHNSENTNRTISLWGVTKWKIQYAKYNSANKKKLEMHMRNYESTDASREV